MRAEDIADVIIASVVPPLTPVFQAAAEQYLKREALVVSHQIDLGIKLLVDNPWETGTDRMISALADASALRRPRHRHPVRHRHQLRLCLARGRLPRRGYRAGAGHLRRGAGPRRPRLYQVELVPPPHALGKNTVHSMQSGIIYGHVGLVEGLVARLREELPGGARARR